MKTKRGEPIEYSQEYWAEKQKLGTKEYNNKIRKLQFQAAISTLKELLLIIVSILIFGYLAVNFPFLLLIILFSSFSVGMIILIWYQKFQTLKEKELEKEFII